MHIELWRILLLTSFLPEVPYAEVLKHFDIQKHIISMEECNLMLVSHFDQGLKQGINLIENRRMNVYLKNKFFNRFGERKHQV